MNNNKFLQIKKNEKFSYYYAERLGKDSVAFILFDSKTNQFGLIKEYKPPIDEFLITAFGGSIDKDKALHEIVADEIREEAGYIDAIIISLGKMFVSTQMNQFCHLFLADVTNAKAIEREPDSYLEQQASVVWVQEKEILNGMCWKAISILTLLRA